MTSKIKDQIINLILTLVADSLSFWGVFIFCISLYNTGALGFA